MHVHKQVHIYKQARTKTSCTAARCSATANNQCRRNRNSTQVHRHQAHLFNYLVTIYVWSVGCLIYIFQIFFQKLLSLFSGTALSLENYYIYSYVLYSQSNLRLHNYIHYHTTHYIGNYISSISIHYSYFAFSPTTFTKHKAVKVGFAGP